MHRGNNAAVLMRERPPRTATHEPCVVDRSDGTSVSATLRNLSDGGFCIESAAALKAGDMVELRILGTRVAGTIRWAKDGRAGGMIRR